MTIVRTAMFIGNAAISGWFDFMDLDTFNDKILKKLKRWSHLGEKIDEYGTQYIGHYNKDTPLAYLHVLYKSGDAEAILAAEKELGMRFPKQFRDFLGLCNGASFFSPAGFNVFGVVQKEYFPELETRPWYGPSKIVENNNQHWLELLPSDALVIGRDDAINGYIVCLTDDGSIVEYDPLEPNDLSTKWDSFDDWLISEIENQFMEYDDNGEILEITRTIH